MDKARSVARPNAHCSKRNRGVVRFEVRGRAASGWAAYGIELIQKPRSCIRHGVHGRAMKLTATATCSEQTWSMV
jgi:hypothetical protein